MEKGYRLITFHQDAWLKPYVDMNNTDLRDTKIQDIEIIKLSLQKKRKKKKLSVVRLKYHTTMFFT